MLLMLILSNMKSLPFFIFIACSFTTQSKDFNIYERPQIVKTALERNDILHYFGVGSNMLKSKVVNRGINGTKILLRNVEPGLAYDYRLAFNMRGFPPIEPAMGGIEPCVGSSCHGALIELDAEEYQKIWLSEGGGQTQPGYEELIIDVYPYGRNQPIKAIVLRAADHVRLNSDARPSKRYMSILLEGAQELGLETEYVDKLKNIPTANPSVALSWLSRQHLYFTSFLFRQKWRPIYRFISFLVWKVHSTSSNKFLQIWSEILTAAVLLPGAAVGLLIQGVDKARGKETHNFFRSLQNAKKS